MRTSDAEKVLPSGTRFTPSEWIGRLIVVFTLTALLFVSALWGCWINVYLSFVPTFLGSSLAVILLAWRSYYSLVSLGYVILLHEVLGLYFLTMTSCCGPGGGVSDGAVILLLSPPALLIGCGLWNALPGRKARMGRLHLLLTLICFLAADPPVNVGGLLRLGVFAGMYWLARRVFLRA